MQARYFQKQFDSLSATSGLSQDLNTLDYLQKEFTNYTEHNLNALGKNNMENNIDISNHATVGRKPELHISKFLTLKLRKQTA